MITQGFGRCLKLPLTPQIIKKKIMVGWRLEPGGENYIFAVLEMIYFKDCFSGQSVLLVPF